MDIEGNYTLLLAMSKLKNNPCKESKDNLWRELNKAYFLIAVDNKTKDSLSIFNTSDGSGKVFLPLFTDSTALDLYIGKPADSMKFFCKDVWELVTSSKEYSGAVINPAKDALPLSLAQIIYLLEVRKVSDANY